MTHGTMPHLQTGGQNRRFFVVSPGRVDVVPCMPYTTQAVMPCAGGLS